MGAGRFVDEAKSIDCIVQYNNKFAKWHPEFSNE